MCPKEGVVYDIWQSERDMLISFVNWFRKKKFNAVCHYNGRNFDMTYIINRINKVVEDGWGARLSPIDKVIWQEWNQTYRVPGVVQFDYQELYLKFIYGDVESKKLDHIAMIELGEGKKPAVYPFHCMDRDMKVTDQKLWLDMLVYLSQDVMLLTRLENKLKYIQLASATTTGGLAIPEAIYSTIPYIDGAIAVNILKAGMIPPSYKKWDSPYHDGKYVGALTLAPVPGRKGWSVVHDAASMYPSSMRQVGISPETKAFKIVGSLEHAMYYAEMCRPSYKKEIPDTQIEIQLASGKIVPTTIKKLRLLCRGEDGVQRYTIGGNGTFYDCSKPGVIPTVLTGWFEERKGYKRKMGELKDKGKAEGNPDKYKDQIEWYDILQFAAKIRLNSVYGACGSPHSGYYDIDNALATTLTAQAVLKASMKFSQEWKNLKQGKAKGEVDQFYITSEEYPECINYGDTDSVFVDVDDLVMTHPKEQRPKVASKLGTELEEYMKEEFPAWSRDYLNSPRSNVMFFEKENVSDTSIFIKAKKYVMHLTEADGYECDKLKIKGLEIVQATTPYKAKSMLKNILQKIVDGDYVEVMETLRTARSDFMQWTVADIAKPSGIRGIDKWNDTPFPPIQGKKHDPSQIKWIERCPWHVKAALIYNYMTSHMPGKYNPIVNDMKMKVVYIKDNQWKFSTIAFEEDFPTEIGLEPDYETQFEKVILSMPTRFFNVLKWPMPCLKSKDLMSIFSA
jgi:DNA polymerase elongation subunit (family B)